SLIPMKLSFAQFPFRNALCFLLGLVLIAACDSDGPVGEPEVKIQWSQTNGPDGGAVYALASVGDNLLAGTTHGIFLSENKGGTWSKVSDAATHSIITVGANLFAATPDGAIVFKNNGNTWSNPSLLN